MKRALTIWLPQCEATTAERDEVYDAKKGAIDTVTGRAIGALDFETVTVQSSGRIKATLICRRIPRSPRLESETLAS